MKYSFPKISMLLGFALIGLVAFQKTTQIEKFKYEVPATYANDFVEVAKAQMCDAKSPVAATLPVKLLATVPGFDTKIALIVVLACVVLTFMFSLLPQRGCFMWLFVRVLTTAFIAVAIFCGFYIYASNSVECRIVKTYVSGDLPKIDFEKVTQHQYYKKVAQMIPEKVVVGAKAFYEIFMKNVKNLGITQPAFVVVIAFYLMNKVTASITKKQVIFLVSLIVSVISGVEYYREAHDIVISIALPVIVVILSVIVFNVVINWGYVFFLPRFFESCLFLTARIVALISVFGITADALVAVAIFAFFFANIFVWTSDGAFLTIVFLLNYGIATLFPLPVDSLAILTFLLFIFTRGETPKAKKAAAEKVKTD